VTYMTKITFLNLGEVLESRAQHLSVGRRDPQDRFKQLCLVLALRMKRVQEIILDLGAEICLTMEKPKYV